MKKKARYIELAKIGYKILNVMMTIFLFDFALDFTN